MSQTCGSAGNGAPGRQPPSPASPSQVTGPCMELRCPKCGGTGRRRWSGVRLCVCATFFICPILMLAGVAMQSCTVFLASSGLTILSLVTIPITWAFALMSRSCCRTCGHRFWPGDQARDLDSSPLPIRISLASSGVLLATLGMGVFLVLTAPGREGTGRWCMVMGPLILAGLAFGLGLLAQAVLWRRLCTRKTNMPSRVSTLMLPAVVIGIASLSLAVHSRYKCDPLVCAPYVLARVQLAPLPPSSRRVRVCSRRAFLDAEDFVRFEADPEDIERFLANSSVVANGVVPFDEARTRTVSQYNSDAPYWYDQPLRGCWRHCDIEMPGNIAELIVDDEEHAVYVYWAK
jgi:hypothetical protein